MSKRSLIFLLSWLALAGSGLAATGGAGVSGQDPDYLAIRGLQAKSGSPATALPKQGAPRPEMMMGLAQAAAAAARPGPGTDYKFNDYDALYALLQKYRDDLKALGLNETQLENQLVALKLKEAELEARINALSKHAADGVRIYGTFSSFYDELISSGPASPLVTAPGNTAQPLASKGNAFRYRSAVLAASLFFTGTRGPLSGLAELDYRYFFQAPWPGSYFFGVRQLRTELRLPVMIQFGDFYGQMSPLTLWRNEDEEPYEPEPFASTRGHLRDDLLLKGNAVNMRGLRLATDVVVFEREALHLQAMFHPLGYPKGILYYMGLYPLPANSSTNYPALDTALLNSYFNTYLAAWQAGLPLGPLNLGYAGTRVWDAADTAGVNYLASNAPAPGLASGGGQPVRGYDSQVHSALASAAFSGGALYLSGEMAQSLYSNPNRPDFYASPNLGASGYLTGTAMFISAGAKADWGSLGFSYRNVERSFISAPAQGRAQDARTSSYGPFLHESSQWNPQNGIYINDYFNTPNAGEDQFNRALLPPQMLTSPKSATPDRFVFNYLLPYNAAVNAGSPYGAATPNRGGWRLEGALNLWKGALKPSAMADVSTQLDGGVAGALHAPEQYTSYRAGAVVDLAPGMGWPLIFKGGWRGQSISNSESVNLSSTLIDFGGEFKAGADLWLSAGLRHMNYSGTLAYPLYGGYGDPLSGSLMSALRTAIAYASYAYDQAYDQWGLGLRYRLNERSQFSLSYTNQVFWDALAEKSGIFNHYQLEQAFAKLDVGF